MPPMTPEPTHSIHSWCVFTPIAEMSNPPHQQRAATNPALRGPARSSQPPHRAAEEPRSTKKSVYIQPRSATFQSQPVVNSDVMMPASAGQATGAVMPIDWLNGSQKTLKP